MKYFPPSLSIIQCIYYCVVKSTEIRKKESLCAIKMLWCSIAVGFYPKGIVFSCVFVFIFIDFISELKNEKKKKFGIHEGQVNLKC